MDSLEREEFKQKVRAFNDEEKEIVLKNISNEMLVSEVNKRLTAMTDKINMVRDILKITR